jgi:predicted phosphodiesterase
VQTVVWHILLQGWPAQRGLLSAVQPEFVEGFTKVLTSYHCVVKIQLLSDLHLESHPQFKATPAPGASVLVLAGDVGSYQSGSAIGTDDWGLKQFSPLHGWPTPVLFVPGNHEYDALDYDAAHARLRSTCAALGITWLDREVLVLGGVRFVGCTLWTDFDAIAHSKTSLTEQLRQRDKAFRAANFYLKKMQATRHGVPLLAEQVRELALEHQAWLRNALTQKFDGTTVVVTHFAPSLASSDPRYGLTPGTAGFCNALDDLLPNAQLWLHGHLHCPQDYVRHGCRVVANPLGYAKKNEQVAFAMHCVVDALSLPP